MYKRINKPFDEIDADLYFKQIKETIRKEILSNSKEYILGVDENDYVSYLVARYTIEEFTIDYDSEEVELYEEKEKERQNEIWYYETYKYTEYIFRVKYNYTGSTDALRIHPSSYQWSIGGSGDVSVIDVYDNHLYIYFTIYKKDKSEFNRTKEGTKSKTFENLNNALWHVRFFNKNLQSVVEKEFEKVKSKYEQDDIFFKELNVKSNKGKNDVYSVPVIQKKVTTPTYTNKSYPSPQLEMAVYKQILRTVYNVYKGFERLPNNYRGKDEEALRDGILPVLQSMYETLSATGETFNKEGKTDISIKESGGGNVFIAECKIWKGEKLFLDAISQLMDRYVTWRDTKTALIVFVPNDGFTEIVEKAKLAIKSHPYYVRTNGVSDETSFSYIFHLANDKERLVYMELMLFHFSEKK